jgi:hypothetical protein
MPQKESLLSTGIDKLYPFSFHGVYSMILHAQFHALAEGSSAAFPNQIVAAKVYYTSSQKALLESPGARG